MGRRSLKGAVRAAGKDRIEFTIYYQGKRYRPTLERNPTEANLRRARAQLQGINERIASGTFNFAEEFPDYRFRHKLPEASSDAPSLIEDPEPLTAPQSLMEPPKKSCGDVFSDFLSHCEMRVAMNDMAYSTLVSYRKILNNVWRPKIGDEAFEDVAYSRLASIAAAHAGISLKGAASGADLARAKTTTKKTYNNVVSALRCAFEHGYKDHPEKHNPASGLSILRITKKDRPVIDPFAIDEAEALITAVHAEWGEAQGNYDEFRFFTGLRPSEQIALLVGDCDLVKRTISVTKARVMSREKDRTKTSEDRMVELNPRAFAVLERHLAFRAQMKLAGKIRHEFLFFQDDGSPITSLQYPWVRWRYVLNKMKVRYREPYNARHSSVTWNLMLGKNLLWVAKMHGHSVPTMLETYAAWIEGSTEADVEAIKRAIESTMPTARTTPLHPPESPETASRLPVEDGWGRLSWRKVQRLKGLTGGERGSNILSQAPV